MKRASRLGPGQHLVSLISRLPRRYLAAAGARTVMKSLVQPGGTALSQVWLFIVAPLVGGLVAAGLHRVLYPEPESLAAGDIPPPVAESAVRG